MRYVSQTLAEEMMNETHDPHFLRKGGMFKFNRSGFDSTSSCLPSSTVVGDLFNL